MGIRNLRDRGQNVSGLVGANQENGSDAFTAQRNVTEAKKAPVTARQGNIKFDRAIDDVNNMYFCVCAAPNDSNPRDKGGQNISRVVRVHEKIGGGLFSKGGQFTYNMF